MWIDKHTITFEQSDMNFIQKFGIMEAADMVLTHADKYQLPFIYDTNQLRRFLEIQRKDMFRLIKQADSEYRALSIKKKNGKLRQLYVPKSKLKKCQIHILRGILSNLPVSQYATAYRKGGTLSLNAQPHIGKKYLLKLDISDFFGSIGFEQVYGTAFHTKYFPKQIGVMLTSLCCRKNTLPQGAPTSPALSNLVMRNFDESIGRWCKNHEINYTRYSDDMTFSSDKPLFTVYQKVKEMLSQMGMELNETKTHFVTNASRQSVTGLTVNEKVSVSKEYKRKLRQELYYVFKFGPKEHLKKINQECFLINGKPNTVSYYYNLCGRVSFVLQIEPDNLWFQKAAHQLRASMGIFFR